MKTSAVSWTEAWDRDATLPTVPEMGAEVMYVCRKLRECQSYSKTVIREYADAERDYRIQRAKLILGARDALIEDGVEKPLAAELTAYVDQSVQGLRHTRNVADSMRYANREAINNFRAELSALQSLLSAYKSELQFARSGGGYE